MDVQQHAADRCLRAGGRYHTDMHTHVDTLAIAAGFTAMPRIDTVVFDIGHVLLEWDPRHLYRKIFDDPAKMEWFLAEVCPYAWNLEQDRGRPWADAEAEAISRHPGYAAQIRAYRARWGEMVPRDIAGTVAILRTLQVQGVPLYAITNFAADTFVQAQQRFPYLAEFRGVVVSGRVGLLKPDPAIYRLLGETYGLDLTRCVFIDDSQPNCASAETVGMAAIHFKDPDDTASQLRRLGFNV
jgi:2-haloacid dehalogenase